MALKTLSTFYYGHNITQDNQYINFSEDGGTTELGGIIPVGAYSLTDFVGEVAKAMNAVGDNTYTVSLDRATRIITINSDNPVDLLVTTGTQQAISAYTLMGFTTDRSAVTSAAADTATGSEYKPQYILQNYVDFEDILESVSSSVNTSASGQVEVINYGRVRMMQANIKYATDIEGQGAITNNPTGVADLRAFMTYATNKYPIEFMRDVGNRDDFIKCIIDKTAKDGKNGTSFQLYELYGQGLAFYFETRNIMFREIS
jgi:hypothetical protein